MPYSTDEDLRKIRPKILEYGVAAWDDQRTEAEATIDRILDHSWYRGEANNLGVNWREYPFDNDLMLEADTQLKTLSCYKTLELAYLHLMKDAPEPDAFERQHGLFKKMFADELRLVLAQGINYDWDESGVLASVEKIRPVKRRLKRC
jgi:hypothetical protein